PPKSASLTTAERVRHGGLQRQSAALCPRGGEGTVAQFRARGGKHLLDRLPLGRREGGVGQRALRRRRRTEPHPHGRLPHGRQCCRQPFHTPRDEGGVAKPPQSQHPLVIALTRDGIVLLLARQVAQ